MARDAVDHFVRFLHPAGWIGLIVDEAGNVPTGEGWLYLAAILDMHTRQIVGWCMRKTLHVEIALDALNMAIERQRPLPGLAR